MARPSRLFRFEMTTGQFVAETVYLEPGESCARNLLAYRPQIYDMILFVVTCKVHQRILLQSVTSNQYFLPLFPLAITNSWQAAIEFYLKKLIKSIGADEGQVGRVALMQVNQFKVPQYGEFLHQLVIQVEIGLCQNNCSNKGSNFRWVPIEQLPTFATDKLWGNEPLHYTQRNSGTQCAELSIPEIKLNKKKWRLLTSLELNEKEVSLLLDDFVQHTYPSLVMNQASFERYIDLMHHKLEVTTVFSDYRSRLFSSFCFSQFDCITFKDLLMGFLALDRRCPHGAVGGQLRTECIYRFYVGDTSQTMTRAELLLLFRDIALTNRREGDKVEHNVDTLLRGIQLSPEQTLDLTRFLELVGKLTIRGTSSLFRATHSPFSDLCRRKVYSLMIARDVNIPDLPSLQPSVKLNLCKKCLSQKYIVAQHAILSTSTGLRYQKEKATCEPRVSNTSLSTIDTNSLFNEMRNILRRFFNITFGTQRTGTISKGVKWEVQEERIQLTEKIIHICNASREMFRRSPRVIKVQSPVYVFGDIHGNFRDLMVYDHYFWEMAPTEQVSNSLFLGDYVDRGDHSIECILYLLCLKLLIPDKFHMLRGNHESRVIQQQFTFYKECLEKFAQNGTSIWDHFNSVFDCMPICAVIDEQIYCAHGGIPASILRLENVFEAPVPMANPNLQCKAVWEILWNDPISRNEFQDFSSMLQQQNFTFEPTKEFLPNIKRGTAFYYSQEAVESFLEANNLICVIRAHEVIPSGFQFHMDGRLVTIFSCSNYCGAVNEAAVIHVDRGTLRVIKIETQVSNQSNNNK